MSETYATNGFLSSNTQDFIEVMLDLTIGRWELDDSWVLILRTSLRWATLTVGEQPNGKFLSSNTQDFIEVWNWWSTGPTWPNSWVLILRTSLRWQSFQHDITFGNDSWVLILRTSLRYCRQTLDCPPKNGFLSSNTQDFIEVSMPRTCFVALRRHSWVLILRTSLRSR